MDASAAARFLLASFCVDWLAGIPTGGGCATMNPLSVGQSRLHPVNTSSMVLPPVITIFPEKKHRSTTGDASGR